MALDRELPGLLDSAFGGVQPSASGSSSPSSTDDLNREDDFIYYLHRGSELLQARRPDEARVALERAFQLSPQNPKAQNLLGLVYFKLGLLEAAKSIYDRLVEEYPSEPPLYVNLGLVLLRQGRLNEAERTLRKAIAIAPDHTRAHCYLGLVLYRRGDLALAREHFLKGQADEFAKKVEQRLSHSTGSRPSQAELLHQVADHGFRDLDASAMPFKPLDYARDERVVRDEEAWEAMVTHDRPSEPSGIGLGMDATSLLPVWALTPLPVVAEDPRIPFEARTPSEAPKTTSPEPSRAAIDAGRGRADPPHSSMDAGEATRAAHVPDNRASEATRLLGSGAPNAPFDPWKPPPDPQPKRTRPLADTDPGLVSPWNEPTPVRPPPDPPRREGLRGTIPASGSTVEDLRPLPLPAAPPDPPSTAHAPAAPPSPIGSKPPAVSAPSRIPLAPAGPPPLPAEPAPADLPEAVLYGDTGPSTQDLIGTTQDEAGVDKIPPEPARPTVPPGFYAGPGSRARLVMETRSYLRSSSIVAASGRLTMTPAMSQLQGHPTGIPFGDPADPMCILEGRAVLLLRVPRVAVALRGVRDLHVVQSGLVGFDNGFTWDNGKVLGIDVVTLRGSGSLLLDTRGTPLLIPVDPETPVHAARTAILAWSDGVRPSPVDGGNGDARLFRLRGRGYVLVAFPPESSSGSVSTRGR